MYFVLATGNRISSDLFSAIAPPLPPINAVFMYMLYTCNILMVLHPKIHSTIH